MSATSSVVAPLSRKRSPEGLRGRGSYGIICRYRPKTVRYLSALSVSLQQSAM